MKTVRLALALAVVGAVGEARAQGGVPVGPPDGFVLSVMALDSTFGVMGFVTGIGSSVAVAQGRVSQRWFVWSAVSSLTNLGLGIAFLAGARELHYGGNTFNPFLAGIAVGHLAIGLWNGLMPIIGLNQGNPATPTIAPVVLSGQDAWGRRWSGLGIQVANF